YDNSTCNSSGLVDRCVSDLLPGLVLGGEQAAPRYRGVSGHGKSRVAAASGCGEQRSRPLCQLVSRRMPLSKGSIEPLAVACATRTASGLSSGTSRSETKFGFIRKCRRCPSYRNRRTNRNADHAQASEALLAHPSRNSQSLPKMEERNERLSGTLQWVEQLVVRFVLAQSRRRGRRRWNRPRAV